MTGAKAHGEGEGPHPIDRHVGLRIRLRRKDLGLTQRGLAEGVGLTFQQVQKYESGANRVSASRLWMLARVLGVPVAFFFEGLPAGAAAEEDGPLTAADDFLLTAQGLELARCFPQLSPNLRRRVLHLVRQLAEAHAVDATV